MRKSQASGAIKTRDIKHFAAIVGIIVGSFLLVLSIGVFAYVRTAVAGGTPAQTPSAQTPQPAEPSADESKPSGGFMANLLLPPEKTNFLIAGVDENDALTDAILVGSFDRETNAITVISIPRDTRVTMSQEDIKALNDVGRYPPSHGVMKINSINAYAGKAYGMEYLTKYLEGILGIEINYYALVDLRAFRKIVDAVDGIWMDIPAGGLYYNDPEQDLTIQVPGGRQMLTGRMAEGVVRFRATYVEGDLKRIQVQQEFMKQFFVQVVNKDAIMKNLGSFLSTVISYVKTDFGIQDIPLYLRYVSGLSADNVTFLTLPGYADYSGEASYFFYDSEQTAEMVREVFYSVPEPEPEPEQQTEITGLKVQLLNGAGAPELTAQFKQTLTDAGVEVVEVGDYTGSRKSYTRVLAREAPVADGFAPYFKDVVTEIDTVAISERFDAVIIIGSAEAGV